MIRTTIRPKMTPYAISQAAVMAGVAFFQSILVADTGYSGEWAMQMVIIQSILLYGCIILLASLSDRKASKVPLYILLGLEVAILLGSTTDFLRTFSTLFAIVTGVPALLALLVAIVSILRLMASRRVKG